MLDFITTQGASLLGPAWPVVWTLVKIVALVLPLMICVAYLTLWERKLLGFMQVRHGPNRVGPLGLLQPIADALKLLTKELIQPSAARLVFARRETDSPALPLTRSWVPSEVAPRTSRRGEPRSRTLARPGVPPVTRLGFQFDAEFQSEGSAWGLATVSE